MKILRSAGAAILAVAAVSASPAMSAPYARPNFIIGVWLQPAYKLPDWAARGVNTAFGYETLGGTNSNAYWSSAAAAAGLSYIRTPGASLSADAADPRLLAFLQSDEPDINNTPSSTLASNYALWRQGAPNVPVVLNVSGGNVLLQLTPQATYIDYFHSADWASNDFYPIAGWGRPDWLTWVGTAVDTLRSWTNGKPQLAFVEASADISPNRSMNSGVVSPGEFRSMVWLEVIHGVRGIVYFPQGFNGGFKYDSTPADIVAEMTTVNARLTSIGATLALAANPRSFPVTVVAPLQVGWRSTSTGQTVIVLNPTAQAINGAAVRFGSAFISPVRNGAVSTVLWEGRTVTVAAGAITDNFAPYTAHVYDIPR